MNVSEDLIKYIAELSKIEQNEEQCKKMQVELGKIIDYMNILNSVDTTEVEPMSHVFPVNNVVREDKVEESFDRQTLLSCAKEHTDESTIVPKTVE